VPNNIVTLEDHMRLFATPSFFGWLSLIGTAAASITLLTSRRLKRSHDRWLYASFLFLATGTAGLLVVHRQYTAAAGCLVCGLLCIALGFRRTRATIFEQTS